MSVESVPNIGELVDQLAFEQEADGWLTEIAKQLPDNDCLYKLLCAVPMNCRKGLYNALRPRLRFKAKPFFLFF